MENGRIKKKEKQYTGSVLRHGQTKEAIRYNLPYCPHRELVTDLMLHA